MKACTFPAAFALLLTSFALAAYADRDERDALACARASDGADQSIVDCYTSRGLPIPADL